MLRKLAQWVLIMIISIILSNTFGLGTQFTNFWYLSICISLYTIISNCVNSPQGNPEEVNQFISRYSFYYVLQSISILVATMIIIGIICLILNIDFFMAYTFVYLGELLYYNFQETSVEIYIFKENEKEP